MGKRVSTVGSEVLNKLSALFLSEARADADMLQRSLRIVEPKQQRTYRRTLSSLMPAKTCNHTVAIALVLDLEHHALVRLIGVRHRLCHNPVKTRAFEAPKPIRGDFQFACRGCQMNRGRRRRK